MHMADALISPVVGGTMWAVSAGMIGYCSHKLKDDLDSQRLPLMGVAGAFVFAAQMINFTIPATGSSGHLGGGLILAILLGPYAAFLTMASVLAVQALLFADGGLLALGCNIFNMGFYPCFIAYPFIYKKIVNQEPTQQRIIIATSIAAIVALQLGAFSVVLQTWFSGISELPFNLFVLLMQPIHLAIGLVEGAATAVVVLFVWKARPEVLTVTVAAEGQGPFSLKKVVIGLVFATVAFGGAVSWFASSQPDGLEWSMMKTSGSEELGTPDQQLYQSLASLQEKTALLPDYGFKSTAEEAAEPPSENWPAVDTGTTVSGLIGSLITLVLASLVGFALKRRRAD